MAIQLPGFPIVEMDHVTLPEYFPDSYMASAFAYPGWSAVPPSEEVNTVQIDFFTLGRADQNRVHEIMDSLRDHIAGGLPFILPPTELIEYAYFESIDPVPVIVPNQFCLPVGPIPICFTPPFAGQVITDQIYQARIWFVLRTAPGEVPIEEPPEEAPPWWLPPPGWGGGEMAALAIVFTPFVILTLIAAFVVVAGTVVVAYSIFTGKASWQEITQYTRDIITAPGENVKIGLGGGLSGAMMAFGLTIVAAGIFLPMLSTSISAKVPIGKRGEIGIGAEAISGRAPASGGSRRR